MQSCIHNELHNEPNICSQETFIEFSVLSLVHFTYLWQFVSDLYYFIHIILPLSLKTILSIYKY